MTCGCHVLLGPHGGLGEPPELKGTKAMTESRLTLLKTSCLLPLEGVSAAGMVRLGLMVGGGQVWS